jgi:hypothetical protein
MPNAWKQQEQRNDQDGPKFLLQKFRSFAEGETIFRLAGVVGWHLR